METGDEFDHEVPVSNAFINGQHKSKYKHSLLDEKILRQKGGIKIKKELSILKYRFYLD